MNEPDLFRTRYPDAPGFKARETARDAAAAIAPVASTLRDPALAILEGSRGLTADQVAAKMGEHTGTIRPRISELVKKGLIRDSGERRENYSGRKAVVCVPVYPAALAGQRRA